VGAGSALSQGIRGTVSFR